MDLTFCRPGFADFAGSPVRLFLPGAKAHVNAELAHLITFI
jgi:hypothetical protein